MLALDSFVNDEAQLAEKLEMFAPGHTDLRAEVLSDKHVWGYAIGPDLKLRSFNACYGLSRVWTISPVYSMPYQ